MSSISHPLRVQRQSVKRSCVNVTILMTYRAPLAGLLRDLCVLGGAGVLHINKIFHLQ